MRDYPLQITSEQYNYLLPVFGNCGSKKLLNKIDRKVEKYYFIGSQDEHKDLLNRCKYLK